MTLPLTLYVLWRSL